MRLLKGFEEDFQLSPSVQRRFASTGAFEGQDFLSGVIRQGEAAFARENMIGSALSYEEAPDYNLPSQQGRPVDFDVESRLRPEETAYSSRFATANSDADVEHIRKQIAKENVMRQALAEGPLPEWLISTFASIADLSTLVPVAGPLVKGGRALTAAETALRVGGSAVVSTGVQEYGLQTTQRTRTSEETVGSIVGSLMFGTALGSVIGAMTGGATKAIIKAAEENRPKLDQEVSDVIGASGLGDRRIPSAGLLDSTAVARFLDNPDVSPGFRYQRNATAAMADHDILNSLSHERPKLFAENARLMAEVDALDNRISRLEADPTLFSRAPSIRDRPTLDLLAALEKSGSPDDLAKAAAIREGAQPAVTLERLYTQRDEILAQWEASEAAIAKGVEATKKLFQEIDNDFTPRSRATAATDAAALYQRMRDELAEGKAPKSELPTDIMGWLRGHAEFPVKPKPVPKGAEAKPKAEGAGVRPAAEVADALKDKTIESASSAGVQNAPASTLNRMRNSFKMAQISAAMKKVGLASPAIELAMSRFEASRAAIQRLVNSGMVTEGHWAGVRGPDDLDTEVRALGTPQLIKLQRTLDAAWADQRAAHETGEPKMTQLAFFQEIAGAMTRNDVSPNPRAQKAAQVLREIDKHFADLATEYGVGVFKNAEAAVAKMQKTAPSHFMRNWLMENLRSNPVGFKTLVKDWFLRTHKGNVNDVADMADEVAETVYHKLLRTPEGRLPNEIAIPEGRGSAKERTFMIPDDWVTLDGKWKASDFLDRNVANVMARYIRTMSADVAYQKILGGDDGFKTIIESIKFEAEDMSKALDGKQHAEFAAATKSAQSADDLEKALAKIERKTDKATAAVWADAAREMRVIEELTNRIRGVDPHPSDPSYAGLKSTLKMVRDYNVVRMLGSSLISQLPDLGAMVMAEGIGRTFGSMIGDLLDGFKLLKMGVKDAQRLGTADDMLLAGRMGAVAELSEQYTRQSRAEIISGLAAHKALMLFGVSPWTVAMKGRASYLGSDSMLRHMEAWVSGGRLSDANRARLAATGIDKEMAERIVAEKGNWSETRGFFTPEIDKWKDEEAANAFQRALLRRINNTILTPNSADRPLWTQTEVGKAMTQFQGFGWAAHNRILIGGLQYRDANTISGVMAMVGLGLTAVALRDIVQKGQIDDKRTQAAWIREAIDRSGVLSRFMEYDAILDKATGGHGVARTLTGEATQRTQSTGFLERVAGPTAGTLSDLSKASAGVINGDFTGADVHSLRRLAPLQNWFLTTQPFNALEEKLVSDFGLQPRQLPK